MSSSATTFHLRRAGLAAALSLSCVLALGLTPAFADPVDVPEASVPTEVSTADDYIVALTEAPVAAYEGDVAGYDATKPEAGESVDVDSADVERYRGYLRKRQDVVAERVGEEPEDRFEVGLAAFTARMTGQQAARLARTGGVASVTKDTLRTVRDERNSTDYLGLSGYHGVWSRLGGADDAGRGVVVGMLDSGIWPESPSFAGEPLRGAKRTKSSQRGDRDPYTPTISGNTITMRKSDGGTFTGICEAGEKFAVSDCSTKIVGARSFGTTWLSKVPADQRADYVSPRDGDGHGSHTASIAAGNVGVRATVDGRDFGTISGVAPAARIASYKVLWEAKDASQSGAYDSDVLDAIDAAISDGVDVINFSVSSVDNPAAPVQLAFLAAARAGIFVAASAGNSGPAASTVQSTSPWVTTVGAHTIAPYYGTVTLGDGQQFAGVSTTVDGTVGPAPLITGAAAALTGQTVAAATACAAGSLDPQRVAGAIVVCARGVVERTVKSAEVERAGGVGMVLTNPTPNTLDSDLHSVPTVHVDPPASAAITTYAGTGGATATLTEGNETGTSIAYPQIAAFSGRGPSVGTGGDTLKPDLVAPGVSILGAVAPSSNGGQDFGFRSGTSQSAPQVAGLAALWFGAGVHPRWSPMWVKSALMTTAGDLADADGKRVTDPYVQGAGRVQPTRMFSPGLVFPAGNRDWQAYLKGLGLGTGSGAKAVDPSNYNSASIAIGRLHGTQTVTRRVTAVTAGRYEASWRLPGVDVDVSPKVLWLDKGETRKVTITLTRTSAAFDQATSGFLSWKSRSAAVRIPVVVTPRQLDAAAKVAGSGSTGTITYAVTPGESGRFTAAATGLAVGDVKGGPDQPLEQGKNLQYAVVVRGNTKAARFTVQASNSQADLNLYLYRVVNGSAVLVAQSVSPAATESILLAKPEAATYVVLVDNVRNAPGTTSTTFEQRSALVVPGNGLGGFTVAPSRTDATAGTPIRLTAGWSDLTEGVPYVGWIEYPNGSGTVVTVN